MTNRFYFLIFLVFLPFLIFHLFTFSQYGAHWDETVQTHLGQASLDYLQGKTKVIELQKDDLVYYGPFFEVANILLADFLISSFKVNQVDASHLLTFLTALFGLLLVYLLAKKLFNQKVGLYSLLFLLFFPRFMAHSHYNSKDIPIAVFCLAVLFFLYQAAVKKKIINFILAGVFTGLALAVQVTSLMILPVFFISYCLSLFLKDKNKNIWAEIKEGLPKWMAFLFTGAMTLFALWPGLWQKPALFFDSINFFLNHGWEGNILYLGKIYAGAKVPWHYPFVHLFITTPVITLAFFGFGFYQILKCLQKRQKVFRALLLISWLFIPLLIGAKPGTVKYDGIRHFLVVIPPLTIMAGGGLAYLEKILKRTYPKNIEVINSGLLTIISVWLIYQSMLINPYGASYFNEALRLAIPKHIENTFEIEYWGTSYREGIQWLNEHTKGETSFCVVIAPHLIQFYPLRENLEFKCGQNTDYLMFFTRKAYLPANLDQELARIRPVYKISRYNSDLLYIYKIK